MDTFHINQRKTSITFTDIAQKLGLFQYFNFPIILLSAKGVIDLKNKKSLNWIFRIMYYCYIKKKLTESF